VKDVVSYQAKDRLSRTTQFLTSKSEKSFKAGTDALASVQADISERIGKMSAPVSNATKRAKKALGFEYQRISKVFGGDPVNISNQLTKLNELAAAEGLEGLDSTIINKIKKISSVADKVDLTVADAITLKRQIADLNSSIFNKTGGASSKSTLGQTLKSINQGIDSKLNEATNGATKLVNKAWSDISEVEELTNSLILRNFKGKAGRDVAKTQTELALKGIVKEAKTAGKDLSKFTTEEILEITGKGGSVIEIGSRRTQNILLQVKALRDSGIPKLQKLADQIDLNLVKIAQDGFNENRIAEAVKSLKKVDKNVTSEFLDKKIAKITQEIGSKEEIVAKLRQQGDEFVVEGGSLIPLYIGGGAASSIAFAAGFPKVGLGITAITGLVALRKHSPEAASLLLEEISVVKRLASRMPENSQIIINKFLDEIVGTEDR